MKLLDHVKKSICNYPSLYLFPDFNSSLIRVLDHMFGTLGNGYEWAKTKNPKSGGYLCEPQYLEKGNECIRKFDKPYGKEKFEKDFSLYLKEPIVNVFHFKTFEDLFTGPLSEFEKHPKKEHWESNIFNIKEYKDNSKLSKYTIKYDIIKSNLEHLSFGYKGSFEFNCWTPYSYFEREYSFLWTDEVKYIQEDWKVGALWWLKECKRYFSDDRVKTYHHYPSPKNIKELEKYIKEYLSSGRYKSIEDVNKAYEMDCFTGDNFEEFSYARWEKELNKINSFIEETTFRLLSF